jgi:hypothetical protein
MSRNEKKEAYFQNKLIKESEIKDTIIQEQNKNCGSTNGIKDIPITISVYGPDLYDLTLIDLPGIL